MTVVDTGNKKSRSETGFIIYSMVLDHFLSVADLTAS